MERTGADQAVPADPPGTQEERMAKSSLVIVESPAKAKTIGKYLGPGYQVKACMGHLRDLPKSTLSVDIENNFEPNYRPIKGKEDIINDLKKSAKASELVYLATDPDREGEAISWHLKELLGLSDEKARRVTFNEITKRVVNESIAAPRDIDQSLVDAQQARRILDRIVGYQLSPLLWKKIRRGLSAGRVQSVATRMVCEREHEIAAAFKEADVETRQNICVTDCNQEYLLYFYYGIRCENREIQGADMALLDKRMMDPDFDEMVWEFYHYYDTIPWDYVGREMDSVYENDDYVLFTKKTAEN